MPPKRAVPLRNCRREKPSRPSGQFLIASSVIIADSKQVVGKSGEQSEQ